MAKSKIKTYSANIICESMTQTIMNKTNYNGEPLQNQQKKFNGSNKNLLLYLIDHNVKTFSQKTTKQLIQIFDSLKQSLYLVQIRQITK